MKNNRNNGFTLAELLIVVAIIAALVAISIPIFTSQIEKSREATDLHEVRQAYSELLTIVMTGDKSSLYNDEKVYKGDNTFAVKVPLTQQVAGWSTDNDEINIAEITYNSLEQTTGKNVVKSMVNEPTIEGDSGKCGICVITYKKANGKEYVSIDWNGAEVDYKSVSSIGQYLLKQVNNLVADALKNNTDLTNTLKANNKNSLVTITLPNGKDVTLTLYTREYDAFQTVTDKFTSTASGAVIYNVNSKEVASITYYDPDLKKYTKWVVDEDKNTDKGWTDVNYKK